jgi:hypothetical protein
MMEATTAVQRPRQVAIAVAMFWTAFSIGVISEVISELLIAREVGTLAKLAVRFVLMLFLMSKISDGRNWARITIFAGWVIGLGLLLGLLVWQKSRVEVLTFFSLRPAVAATLALMALVQIVLWAYGLFLLFTRPGKDWFRPVPK